MNGLARFCFWVAVIAGAIGAIAYYAFFDVWTVPGDDPRLGVSILPTLATGDIVLVRRHGQPMMGNLARCEDPDEPRRFIVARVAALAGAPIHVTGQAFSTPTSRPTGTSSCPKQRVVNPANGDELELDCREEEFAGTAYQILTKSDKAPDHDSETTVPTGRVFLMSDDRYLHLDSRDYGTLAATSCQHIVFRLWGAGGFMDSSRRFNLIW